MKKSLIVLAVAGALSMGAQAATVEVYGLIDTSLVYMHTDADNGEKGKTDKSLIVLAVAGALSMGAQAATVEVYGLIDTSLVYMHTDADNGEKGKTDSLTMETAQQMGSRWGLRGSEDLGNGYKVGFTLESGFESDTGALEVKQGNFVVVKT